MNNQDQRIVITDHNQVITAEQFWNPKLVVMAKIPDHQIQKQSVKQYLRQYHARVIWTYDEKTILAVLIPNDHDLTFFMLAHTELYHFKQKFWENHARNYWSEIDEEIKTLENNLLEAHSRKQLLESKGPVVYRKHVENIYGVQSSALKKLLRTARLGPLGSVTNKAKPKNKKP
jgi:predicted AlkP superfamily phosphohydrolase/phosphomutase